MSVKQPEPEAAPVEAEPVAQPLEDMSAEDIAKLIDNPAPEEPEVVEAAEPEAEQPEAEPVAESEPPAPEVEAAAEPEPDRLARLEELFEKSELQREAEAQRNSHLRLMLDRKNGEIGHLRQAPAPVAPVDDYGTAESVPTEQNALLEEMRREAQAAKHDRFTTTLLAEAQAARDRQAELMTSLDKLGGNIREEFEGSLNKRFGEEATALGLNEAVSSLDVKLGQSIVKAAFGAALAETRIEFMGKTRAQASAAAAEKTKQQKLDAAAGGESTSRPTATPRGKTLSEMTAEEIKAEIDRREAAGIVA
jgi:hypothetical protein